MKKYYFEADKQLWEKAYQGYACVQTMPARVRVFAENDSEAQEKAAAKFQAIYHGTGIILGGFAQTACSELPVDWSYGYGDQRKTGPTESIPDMVGGSVIK